MLISLLIVFRVCSKNFVLLKRRRKHLFDFLMYEQEYMQIAGNEFGFENSVLTSDFNLDSEYKNLLKILD